MYRLQQAHYILPVKHEYESMKRFNQKSKSMIFNQKDLPGQADERLHKTPDR